MFADWRHTYANIALTGGNLFFLVIVAKYPTPTGLMLASCLIGTSSFFAWYANLRRYRTIADTPTSRVNSAPQGYIELVGKGVYPDGKSPLTSPVSSQPCLWYRYLVETKTGNKWHRVDSGTSNEQFGLDDGTGLMLIDPANAEVITSNKHVTKKRHSRHTEWLLVDGEILYVIGEHLTQSGSTADLNLRNDVSDLLAEWKRDRVGIMKRFDLDGDGKISIDEWEAARKAAKNEVDRAHLELRLQAGSSIIRKPKERLFLIANRPPGQLMSRYLFWAWTHLGLLVIASLTVAIVL